MDSPTTPKPTHDQTEPPKPKKVWHEKVRSAGLGWMERSSFRFLLMYFDIRDFVLEDMSATAQEVDFLILRRLIPRPLTYPRMEELKDPPPDGFQRITLRYLTTDISQPLDNNREDIVPALRRIRIHLKKFRNVPGPFRSFEIMDPDMFLQSVVLKLDFHAPRPEPKPEPEFDYAETADGVSEVSDDMAFELSDCSSFGG